MKKLFTLLTLVVLGITTFTACSKDDENTGAIGEEGEFVGDGSITMVTEGNASFGDFDIKTFNEGDAVTIDWGDGKVEVLKSVKVEHDDAKIVFYEIRARHTYSTRKQYTIKITSNMKIKGFYNLCSLTSLDVSQCTSLKELGGSYGDLTSLDASGCVKLEFLYCHDNQFTSLDVSGCVNLVELWCSTNQLTSLDASGCVKLKELYCGNNQLTSLNVSGCVKLQFLLCERNQFTASAMNQIYNALPDWNDIVYGGQIRISQPYGDYSIAKGKKWTVDFN